jgi:3-phosphoglycerate kinase
LLRRVEGDLAMKTIDDLVVAGQRVLVRDDFNVPLDGGRVTDDGRIRAALPNLTALLDRDAKVIVCAHLGRPAGQPDPRYSLTPAAARLSELLGRPVELAADTAGPSARAAVAAMRPGGLVMLENLRFNAGETSKDDVTRGAFADQLAALADLYADTPDYQQDAFTLLAEAIAEMCTVDPDVQVCPHVLEGRAGQVLVDAAEGADLLVVGSRGHGALAEALLGSVGQHCVHHAPCPVLIMRGKHEG